MGRALVCVLLVLLLSLGGASSVKGTVGLCRVWRPETRPFLAVFSCPEKHDPPDAVFCCGTCGMPHCCSSEEDQLDQRRCHVELLPTTPPPPVAVPADWYYMCFFLGVVTIALAYACVNLFSTQIRNCLLTTHCCWRRPWCCREPRQEVQVVAMGALPTHPVIDTPPSSVGVSMHTVSTCAEDLGGSVVPPPAWDDAPVRGSLASGGIPENDAIVLSPAALLNTSVSCPILEAAVETEDLPLSGQ